MLFSGETFNQRKARLLGDIRKSRDALKLYQKCMVTFPNQVQGFAELVVLEKELLNDVLLEIIELKRWRNKIGIGVDDEFTGLQTKKSS